MLVKILRQDNLIPAIKGYVFNILADPEILMHAVDQQQQVNTHLKEDDTSLIVTADGLNPMPLAGQATASTTKSASQ